MIFHPDVAAPVFVGLVSVADFAESVFVGLVSAAPVSAALVSAADLADPQNVGDIAVDIAVAFDVLVVVSVVAVEVDSPGRPRFFAVPNSDYYSSYSSSVEVVG